MKISERLREARLQANLSQEKLAEEIHVSRQTISNWENGKTYPDIMSILLLSDLYEISLDELLKGDKAMVKYLEESTNTVESNKKIIFGIIANIIIFSLMILFSGFLEENKYYLMSVFIVVVITTSVLFYQIIKKI
ncbi:MAG: helix-turn-helix transcriptional regulator [Gallicola sp.]|nr:helix-turn-helix transcriptional regulator [Gallicola sp.]